MENLPTQISLLKEIELDFIGKFIKWMAQAFGSIGVAVIMFTLIIKLATAPLDIFSKISMKKNSLKMEKLKPQLEKLKKQYANNPTLYQQKMSALYKKEGYSMVGACLPTIVTLVVFIMVFSSFRTYTAHQNVRVYNEMAKAYNAEYTAVYDATYSQAEYDLKGDSTGTQTQAQAEYLLQVKATADDKAGYASKKAYEKYNEGFLWIKNIFIADSYFEPSVPKSANGYEELTMTSKGCGCNSKKLNIDSAEYKRLVSKIDTNEGNGYFILIALSIGSTILSQFIMNKTQKAQMELQGQSAGSQKMMMFILPIMIGIFAFFYSSAFSIYMISNTVFGILTTYIVNLVVSKKFEKAEQEIERSKYERKTYNGQNNKK